MPSISKVTCPRRISATLCGMLISAPVRLRSQGIDRRLGGLHHGKNCLQFFTVDRSLSSYYAAPVEPTTYTSSV
jgi:hypothetical protein